jgi:tRNA (guanine-N7-)-methyltransferase
VEEMAREMGDRFRRHPAFQLTHAEPWLSENPFPIPTEREIATLNKNKPIYRQMFQKIDPYTVIKDSLFE